MSPIGLKNREARALQNVSRRVDDATNNAQVFIAGRREKVAATSSLTSPLTSARCVVGECRCRSAFEEGLITVLSKMASCRKELRRFISRCVLFVRPAPLGPSPEPHRKQLILTQLLRSGCRIGRGP